MINLKKPSLNELTHYGVLGMKWGVRRSTQPGYSKNPKFEEVRDLIKKGSIVYRISSKNNEVDSGRTFVFADSKDADKFAQRLKEISPNNATFKISLKVKNDLIGPSEKERVDQFLEGYKHKTIKDIVDYTKKLALKSGIDLKDKDGNKLLETYRAYTIAVSKDIHSLGKIENYETYKVKNFQIRRDDYMRGYTNISKGDKKPIDNLDSAYMVFSRLSDLESISAEEVKTQVKHSIDKNPESLYASYPFFNPNLEEIKKSQLEDEKRNKDD